MMMLVVLLIITLTNYSRRPSAETIRAVDFLTIWSIGAISGLLIYNIVQLWKGKNSGEA